MRTRTLLLLATVVTVVPVWLAGLAVGRDAPARTGASASAMAPPTSQSDALALLRRWDRRRARAWSKDDVNGLARLYVRGSRTGRRDVTDLEQWRRRGLRVTGLRQQIAALRLLDFGRDRVDVVVTERTVDAVAVSAGRRLPVPRSAWAIHRISLRRIAGTWRVAEARAQPAR